MHCLMLWLALARRACDAGGCLTRPHGTGRFAASGIHAAEKVMYGSFNKEGKLLDASNQFAMGIEDAYKARVNNKQASN